MNTAKRIFQIGEKVAICGEQGFKIGATGTINYPPKNSVCSESYANNYFREVDTLQGKKVFVWVVFDELQYDADNDGPYSQAEIVIDSLKSFDK